MTGMRGLNGRAYEATDILRRRSPRTATRLDHAVAVATAAIVAVATLGAASTANAAVTLVDAGEPAAVIVLPADPHEYEQQAADELVEHINLISGATLSVVSEGDEPAGLTPIRIGAAADDALASRVRDAQREIRGWNLRDDQDTFAFALWVEEGAIQLRGGSGPGGTRTAAYELLEQLGVRWYMPGDLGRVVPEADTVTIDTQETIQVPSFHTRDQRGGPVTQTWKDRNREGRALGRGRPGRHGTGGSPSRSEQPEYWGMRADGSRGAGQLCLTGSHDNPDDPADPEQNYVLGSVIDHYLGRVRDMSEEERQERVVFNTGPRDGGGYCLCDMCRELDPPDYVGTPLRRPTEDPSYTDRYVWFYNQVSKAIAEEFPDADVLFGFYAYGGLMHPPYDVEPMGNLAISVAPIHVCRRHGPNNPVCPDSNYYKYMLEGWKPYVEEVWCRGYTWNLADPQFPFPMMQRVREEIPLNYEMGMIGYGTDANHSWVTHNPLSYAWARLMWDHTTDVDALVAEFYEKFYGPASEPMAAYHELMEELNQTGDYHTGSIWDHYHVYPPEQRRQARSYLEQALDLAQSEGGVYVDRVSMMIGSLDMLDAYCDLWEHRYNFDFAAERDAMLRIAEARDHLLEDYEYPVIMPRHSRTHYSRFIERTTMAHYETHQRTEAIVAKFDHQWQFHQDRERWGRYIGLHRPESEGGNWQTIRTDTSWSNQGLRYYFGQTWYRQTVDVPEGFENDTIRIWFAGVDRTAEVWVNGQWVGANHDGAEFDLDAHGSAFRPFEFDVTDAIRHGEPNVVAVRSYRTHTNELGTGGITGPVMFYVPSE